MRQDLNSPNIFDAWIKSAKLSHSRKILDGTFTITVNGAIANFLDAGGANRDVMLPSREEGLFYIIANVGAANNLIVKDAGGNTLSTVQPGQTFEVFSSEDEWQGIKSTTDLDVFTNTVDGLVPAPNSAVPGSLFLRDDGQWGQIQVVGIVDAFKYISDGTNIAVGAGPDTFRLRSSTGSVGITVTNNEAVFGDNANFDVIESAVDHDLLLNFVADKHIAHSSVSISAGQGLTGGGTIAANRTLSLDINGLSVIAPVLADSVPFYDLSGTTQGKATFTVINGILVHNSLSGYVADEHVAHSGVSIVAGVGLSGGGTIASSRTLNLNYTTLPTDDAISAADLIAFYDSSEADHNTTTLALFNAALDHDVLTNYSANEHIDHTAVSISAGTGLTGGGTIAANRTLSFADIADDRILANISGGSAPATANTLTAIIDSILGNTRGQIIVRGAATWSVLGVGANNTYLKSDGTDPSWQTIVAGGDVVGPASSTDSGFAKFDGTTGKLLKNSAATVAIADGGTGSTSASAALTALGAEPAYASGTAKVLAQTSAPTGYTKSVAHNNKALRVTTGTVGSGGTIAFTTAFAGNTGNTVLANSHLPTAISATGGTFAAQSGGSATVLASGTSGTGALNNTGGGQGHNHSMPDLQYMDVIVATKN